MVGVVVHGVGVSGWVCGDECGVVVEVDGVGGGWTSTMESPDITVGTKGLPM